MREIVSPLSGIRSPFGQLTSPLAIYAVLGIKPELVFDFDADKYFVNSRRSTFSDSITHSRASTATYVDSTGTLQTAGINEPRIGHHIYNGSAWVNEGLLHESEARTNLITYSEDFTNGWSLSLLLPFGSGSVSNATTAPDGNSTADLIVPTTDSSNTHYIRTAHQPALATGAVGTFSIFVKAAGYTSLSLRLVGTDAAIINYDLTAVTADDAGGSIEDVENGWYRCTITGTGVGSTAWPWVYPNQQLTYAGDGTSGIYIYGAQFEAAPTPSSYIPTTGSTATRAAETLTVPSANLPWPTPNVIGDELVTNGTFDTDLSGWTESTSGVVTWDATGAALIGDGNTVNNTTFTQTLTGLTVGAVYQLSVDINTLSGAGVRISWDGVNLEGGDYLSSSQTFTLVAAASSVDLAFFRFRNHTGEVLIDNISVREIDPLAVSIQMDGRMTYADEDATDEVVFFRKYADVSNNIRSRLRTDFGTGRYDFLQVESGTTDFVSSDVSEASPGILQPFNIASRHGSTFINGAVDGTEIGGQGWEYGDTTPVALPDLSATDMNLGYDYNGTIKTFRVWAADLGDTGIEDASG